MTQTSDVREINTLYEVIRERPLEATKAFWVSYLEDALRRIGATWFGQVISS